MDRARRHIFATRLITAILTVVLAALGFAHRPAAVLGDAGLAAYVTAGGSIADLCDADGSTRLHGGTHCDACRLVGAAILPVPYVHYLPGNPRLASAGTFPAPLLRPEFPRDPSRVVRGPPLARFS